MVGGCDSNLHTQRMVLSLFASFFLACNSGVDYHRCSQGTFLKKQTLRQRFAGSLLYKIGD